MSKRFSNNHYNKKLKAFAKYNRRNLNKSEACMWKYVLANRQMLGYQFRRQRAIGFYIADFVCLPLKLVIEVDGLSHENTAGYNRDIKRDIELKQLGFTTLRYSSKEVLREIRIVRESIENWISEHATCPPPNPRQRGTKST